MTAAAFSATSYEPIDPGIYPGRLDSIESGTSETYGEFRKWNFTLKLTDGSFQTLSAVSSTASGPKSKGYKWAAALLGRNPKAGETLDLTGKLCQVHVIVNDDGFNRVEAVLPVAATGGTSPASQADATIPQKAEKIKPVPFEQTVEVQAPDEPLPF